MSNLTSFKTVSKATAFHLVYSHGHTVEEFIVDCGDHETYTGVTVAEWLGY